MSSRLGPNNGWLFVALLAIQNLCLAASPAAPERATVCGKCHAAQMKTSPSTSMGHALESVADGEILRTNKLVTFTDGQYSYRIERQGDQSIYSVSDGAQTLTVPIEWAFGLGAAGQTYVFAKDGEFYESRVSFFRELGGLDLTLGAASVAPKNILQAAGHLMDRQTKARCFGCHATNAAQGLDLTLDKMTPGVRCERCHGPTENHLEGLKKGDMKLFAMKKLSQMSTEQMSNYCGQCHRTWEEIALDTNRLGIQNVRFQPYRLTNSKCYDAEDPRISCVACHDPHVEVSRKVTDYDGKCQACHGGGRPGTRACKVATSDCSSCHMPKIEIPGSHHKFSDHQIRIVRVNEKYPE
jgi:hypothetical protein